MTKAEKTRRYILEKTAPLFNQAGFDGTSLSELEKTTGLSKGSIYGNFRDKDELAAAAFHFAMDRVRETMMARLSVHTTYSARLWALLTFYGDHVFNPPVAGGCPLLNHAVEADDHRRSMREEVSAEIEKVIAYIVHLIECGKRRGEFRCDAPSRDLACMMFASLEGALMVSRVSGSDASMKAVLRQLKSTIDQISITCNHAE